MSQDPVTVTVSILGRDYKVASPAEEQQALEQSARYLDSQMRRIRNSGKVVGTERISVMAALNLTHELLALRAELDHLRQEQQGAVDALAGRVETALERTERLRTPQ